MDYTKQTCFIGKAGELRVRSELLLRDFSCAVFDQDCGCDIVLNNGIKIQVKTSTDPIKDKKAYSWKYTFSVRQSQVRNSSSGKGMYEKKFIKRDYKGIADYFVFWCVKDNLFYIIPEKEIKQKVSLVIATPKEERTYKKHTWKDSTSKYEKYKNNWEQLL